MIIVGIKAVAGNKGFRFYLQWIDKRSMLSSVKIETLLKEVVSLLEPKWVNVDGRWVVEFHSNGTIERVPSDGFLIFDDLFSGEDLDNPTPTIIHGPNAGALINTYETHMKIFDTIRFK